MLIIPGAASTATINALWKMLLTELGRDEFSWTLPSRFPTQTQGQLGFFSGRLLWKSSDLSDMLQKYRDYVAPTQKRCLAPNETSSSRRATRQCATRSPIDHASSNKGQKPSPTLTLLKTF
jgi:hypothetical protein